MKKFNKRKVAITLSLLAALGSVAIAFQNFTPHEPFKNQDAKDLFLNGALTEALEDASKEHQENRLAANVDADQIEAAVKQKKKKPTTIEIQSTIGVDDEASGRTPANIDDKRAQNSQE